MAYYNRTYPFSTGTTAEGTQVKAELDALASSFNAVEVDVNRSIKMPVGSSVELPSSPATRSLSVIGFDENGDIETQAGVGRFRGDWITGRDYIKRDVIVDAAGELGLRNVYICNEDHASSALLASDSGKWSIMIDITDVVASEVASVYAASLSETARANSVLAQLASEQARDESVVAKDASELAFTNMQANSYTVLFSGQSSGFRQNTGDTQAVVTIAEDVSNFEMLSVTISTSQGVSKGSTTTIITANEIGMGVNDLYNINLSGLNRVSVVKNPAGTDLTFTTLMTPALDWYYVTSIIGFKSNV